MEKNLSENNLNESDLEGNLEGKLEGNLNEGNLKERKKSICTFTERSLMKAMLIFVGPYMLGILVQNLYGAVNLLVVGQFAEIKDISAVRIGSQLMSLLRCKR